MANPFDVHASVPLTCTILPDKEIWTAVLEGGCYQIEAEAANWVTGNAPQEGNTFVRSPICQDTQGEGATSGAVVTQSQIQRREGVISELHIAYTYLRKVELWSIDMAEISKDIKTWLSSEKGGYTEQQAAPILAKIAQWEAFKDAGDYIKWQNFVYDEQGDVLEGDALTLAIKIMKGVSAYTIYAPVLTRTTLWNAPPPMENDGYIDTPDTREGWDVLGGKPIPIDATIQWLKNGCRSHPNGDGTYTLTEQWMGADEIDGDLYPTAPSEPENPPAPSEGDTP